MRFVAAMNDEDLWTGEMCGVRIAGRRILLMRLEDGVRAYEDRCPHLGVPLSQGRLDGCVLTCSAHHYQYDARTGAGINPISVRLVPLRTCISGGKIGVELSVPPSLDVPEKEGSDGVG